MSVVTLENWIEADRRIYNSKLYSSPAGMVGIRDALEKGVTGIINQVNDASREDIFYMLCFCISVPQSKAVKVDEAINTLRKMNFYSNSLTESELIDILKSKARFHNRKSSYLLDAKKIFLDDDFWDILQNNFLEWPNKKLDEKRKFRDFIVQTFRGIGLKESSHILRNIGMFGLAILDVHILNELRNRGLIQEKIWLTRSNYCDIEDIMLEYAGQVGISLEELDLLFWSNKTGFVFK